MLRTYTHTRNVWHDDFVASYDCDVYMRAIVYVCTYFATRRGLGLSFARRERDARHSRDSSRQDNNTGRSAYHIIVRVSNEIIANKQLAARLIDSLF